jgi:hypothetical protein
VDKAIAACILGAIAGILYVILDAYIADKLNRQNLCKNVVMSLCYGTLGCLAGFLGSLVILNAGKVWEAIAEWIVAHYGKAVAERFMRGDLQWIRHTILTLLSGRKIGGKRLDSRNIFLPPIFLPKPRIW